MFKLIPLILALLLSACSFFAPGMDMKANNNWSELDVPVILLSQVNKDGETKHARATVEDCDSLWKIENDGELNPTLQTVKLIVEKCRDGSTGLVVLEFFKEFTRFESQSKVHESDVPNQDTYADR